MHEGMSCSTQIDCDAICIYNVFNPLIVTTKFVLTFHYEFQPLVVPL